MSGSIRYFQPWAFYWGSRHGLTWISLNARLRRLYRINVVLGNAFAVGVEVMLHAFLCTQDDPIRVLFLAELQYKQSTILRLIGDRTAFYPRHNEIKDDDASVAWPCVVNLYDKYRNGSVVETLA